MKILVIRFSSLGDAVLTTALLPNIKAHWPQAEIDVLTKPAYAPVFEGNPAVHRLIPLNVKAIRETHYDVVFDLHSNLRSWFLRVVTGPQRVVAVDKRTLARQLLLWFRWKSPTLKKSVRECILDCLKPLSIPVVSTETQLFAPSAGPVLINFGLHNAKKLIGIAPGAKHKTKEWGAARFAEAANRLGAIPGSLIVLLGSPEDEGVSKATAEKLVVPYVDLTGRTSLSELMAVTSKLSLLLTNDSGIMHIAEAFSVPTVAIFGPTVREFGFAPYRSSSRVAETKLRCRPCTLHGGPACPLGHHNCMNDLDVNAVLFAASSLLDKSTAGLPDEYLADEHLSEAGS